VLIEKVETFDDAPVGEQPTLLLESVEVNSTAHVEVTYRASSANARSSKAAIGHLSTRGVPK
jgi:hypothetical protein